jgi:hypothetical protein
MSFALFAIFFILMIEIIEKFQHSIRVK